MHCHLILRFYLYISIINLELCTYYLVIFIYSLFDEELDYVEELLEEDLRNNSAWNQRYFVISMTSGFTNEVIEREVAFTQRYINKVVDNESPWSYLRGCVEVFHTSLLCIF